MKKYEELIFIAALVAVVIGFLVSEAVMMATFGLLMGSLAFLVATLAILAKFNGNALMWVLLAIWYLVAIAAMIVLVGTCPAAVVVIVAAYFVLGAAIVYVFTR